jgi:hypothetical protein
MLTKGYDPEVVQIMLQARRPSSLKIYEGYLTRWKTFCTTRNIDMIHPTVANGLQFLELLFKSGLGYSTMNSARSALSSVILLKEGTFGAHPDVKLFLKGIFNLRPTQSKYISTWDPAVVLTLLEQWFPASDISLEKLK